MLLQIISDTHSDLSRFKPKLRADLIVHAGDFTKTDDSLAQIYRFVAKCEEANKKYVFVLGNHDYYNQDREELISILEEDNVNILYAGKEYHQDGYIFVGDTLFTEFNLPTFNNVELNKKIAEVYISDFVYTKYSADDYAKMFKEQLDFINKYKHKDNVIVITHFSPSPKTITDKWKGDILNPYFSNNISLIGFKHWICGHQHHTDLYDVDGCNIYINASGYSNDYMYECQNFNDAFVIKV